MNYVQPLYPLLLLITGFGAYRCYRRSKGWEPRLMLLGMIGLTLVSWKPVACLGLRPLQQRYAPQLFPAGDAQTIVVLVGNMEPSGPVMPTPRLGRGSYGRCQYAAYLYTHWRRLPILACGGPDASDLNGPPASITMGKALEREGVPPSMILCEGRSHSTYENSLYASEILRKKGVGKIVLVTDAYHMLRAEKCFRKQGFLVVPAPCTFRAFGPFKVTKLIPGWEPISWNEDALHEIVGLFWYWARGWI